MKNEEIIEKTRMKNCKILKAQKEQNYKIGKNGK